MISHFIVGAIFIGLAGVGLAHGIFIIPGMCLFIGCLLWGYAYAQFKESRK